MLATFDLEHNEPRASNVEGKSVLLSWGALNLLLSYDEARTLITRLNDVLPAP